MAWSSPKGSPFIPSTLLHGDYLYMINDMSSILTVYRATTGQVMYQQRLGRAARESFSASPVVVGDKIFITNDAGDTFVVAAGPEENLLHVNRIGERTLASPALVDGTWYIRTDRGPLRHRQLRPGSRPIGPSQDCRGREACIPPPQNVAPP